MNAQALRKKHYDRFSTAPILDDAGRAREPLMNKRQVEVLKAIWHHRLLTTLQIHATVGGNLRHLRETIRLFKAVGLIQIETNQLKARNFGATLCYQLTDKGVEWLKARGYAATKAPRVYSVEHDIGAGHLTISIQAGIEADRHARFIFFDEMQRHEKFPESTRKSESRHAIPHPRKNWIHPDTEPFGIELKVDGKSKFLFGVGEYDNGTDDKGETLIPTNPAKYNGSSIYEKLEGYVPFIHNELYHDKYGLPNFYLFFLFRSKLRMERAQDCLRRIRPEGSRFILFHLVNPDGAAGYLFTTPWSRVGKEYDSLYLNKP